MIDTEYMFCSTMGVLTDGLGLGVLAHPDQGRRQRCCSSQRVGVVGTEDPLPSVEEFLSDGSSHFGVAGVAEVGDRSQQQVPKVLMVIAEPAVRQDVRGKARVVVPSRRLVRVARV